MLTENGFERVVVPFKSSCKVLITLNNLKVYFAAFYLFPTFFERHRYVKRQKQTWRGVASVDYPNAHNIQGWAGWGLSESTNLNLGLPYG